MNSTYKALGFSDQDHCEHCGRTDIKRTVRIVAIDADGNRIGNEMFFGTTCAARATGRDSKAIASEAAAADHNTTAARREAADFIADIARNWGDRSATGLIARTKALAGARAAALGDSDYHRALRTALLAA